MAEYQVDATSVVAEAHGLDCAFVCELLRQYPCAAYEAYKNAPASIQSNIDVAQVYLESRQAHRRNISVPDQEKSRIATGNTFSPEGEARLAELLDRFKYFTEIFNLSALNAFDIMRIERTDGFKKEILAVELPVFD